MQSAVHNVHNMQLCFQFCLHSVPYDESWIDLVLAKDDRRRALGTGHKGVSGYARYNTSITPTHDCESFTLVAAGRC